MDSLAKIEDDLGLLREAEALIYYRADAGDALDADGLKSICARRSSLLADPSNVSLAERLAKSSDDPVERRKAYLLGLQMLAVRLDEAPAILALRHELEQAEHSFKDVRSTAAGMRAYLSATQGCARQRIKAANAVARNEGFPDYPTAKLSCQELSYEALIRTLEEACASCGAQATSAVAGLDGSSLSPNELDAAVTRRLLPADERFPADGMADAVGRTLVEFGVEPGSLPVKIEFHSLPYWGAVHALKIGRDVRIVMSKSKGGLRRYSVLFHELGHALYYVHVPDTVLLLDGREAREGLADTWAGLVARQEWLEKVAGCSASDANVLLDRFRALNAYMLMTFVRETLFELALYRDPDADFLDVWNGLTRKCFGFDDSAGAYSDFVFTYPLDIKDYIYAERIKSAILCRLERRFGAQLLKPEVLDLLIREYYRPGNASPWVERLL